jgi:hypothetical protein
MSAAAGQRGAVVLLLALLLLTLLLGAALAGTRNVLREWEICGSELAGTRALLAAESGLARAAAGQAGPEFPPGAGGMVGSVQVQGRFLGLIDRPGPDPEPCLELWEWTAHGYCQVGPDRYHQICQAWCVCPAVDGARPRAWQAWRKGSPPLL